MAVTVTRKKVYRVPAAHRPTYNALAELCRLHGPTRQAEAIARHPHMDPERLPRAFTVLSADEWLVWSDESFPSGEAATYTHADVKAMLAAPEPEAKPKRTTKAQLVAALRRLEPSQLTGELAELLAAA